MAVERVKEFTIDLGEIVKIRLESFSNSRKKIQLAKEAEFQRRIAEEGLSYNSQLDYRNKQLAEEEAKIYPDIEFIEEIKSDISNLKKFVRYEKVRNNYLEKYTQWKEGKMVIEHLINFLGNQLVREADPILRKEVLENLSKARIDKADAEMDILDSRITLATKDKSVSLIDTVIGEVETRRNAALLVGDRETIAALDVKLATLRQERTQIITTDKVYGMELEIVRKGIGATGKLDLLNNVISTADRINSVLIGGIRWNSEYEYWTTVRDAYISGSGGGEFKNFFEEYSGEIKNRITKLGLVNQFGSVPASAIITINSDYGKLATRPEFVNYLTQLEEYRTGSLSSAVDKTAKAIIAESEFLGTYDAGTQSLKNLEAKTGISMTSYIGDLYYTKITAVPAKYSALRKTSEIMTERITGVEFDPDNPEHQRIAGEEFQKLLVSPLEPKPTVTKEVEEELVIKPELIKKKEELERQIEETKRLIEEEKAKRVIPPTPEVPKVEEPKVEAPPKVKEPKLITHTVATGETLWGIASKYLGAGRRWKELKTPEGVAFTEETARRLQIGQKLVVPPK